jgi:DNA recombination protein RmuC
LSLNRVYSQKMINIDARIDPGLLFYGEQRDLLELMGNLLDNAFKYGTSRVHLSGGALSPGASRPGLWMQIEDDGPGIAENQRERLHEDASNLSRALTGNVKAQGNWGEQQLERLLEVAGLQKGVEYSTQYSVTTTDGQRIQPDLVLHLPEGKSIVLDSKVSLLAWIRYQASADDEAGRAEALKEHIQSIRQHIRGLGEKRYAEIPELNSLDFVLMFMPIESALIEALQADPGLAEFALRNKVALLSPTNFIATMRTVGSVWSVHKQNRNAQEIARRAGLLYDKFAGFVENLQAVGDRLGQAQQSYEKAFGQLSTGAGNLLRQTESLRELGARNTRQLERKLLEPSGDKPPES